MCPFWGSLYTFGLHPAFSSHPWLLEDISMWQWPHPRNGFSWLADQVEGSQWVSNLGSTLHMGHCFCSFSRWKKKMPSQLHIGLCTLTVQEHQGKDRGLALQERKGWVKQGVGNLSSKDGMWGKLSMNGTCRVDSGKASNRWSESQWKAETTNSSFVLFCSLPPLCWVL